VVNDRIRLGVSPQDALQELVIRLPSEALNMLAATVRVAIRTGGPMALLLDQTGKRCSPTNRLTCACPR